jgi:predicted nucleic acid-binding protein
VIRFWDTSALVKIFHRQESAHARATNLIYGAGKTIRQMTSMIVAVELVAVVVRETRDRPLARQAVDLLRGFDQMEFTEAHRDLAVRLALAGQARGADTAIAAQGLALAALGERLEFVTADLEQSRVIGSETRAHRLKLRLILLSA